MRVPPCPSWIPVRYIFTLLAFIGFVFNYTLRVNINLVVTFMVNYTAINDTDHASQEDGPFAWDSVIRNDVMGLFFAGYMTFQMPGGRLAELFGGKRVKRQQQSHESLQHTSHIHVACAGAGADDGARVGPHPPHPRGRQAGRGRRLPLLSGGGQVITCVSYTPVILT